MPDEQAALFHRRVGALLAKIRESRGLSQEALAVQLQCDQSYVSRIESAERHASVLLLLEWADVLNIPFEELAREIEKVWRYCVTGRQSR